MYLLKNLSFLILAVMLSSCGSTKNTTSTYWVNSAKVDCDAGAGKATCLQVTKSSNYENAEWSLFYAPIKGFNFEPGYLQKIKVSETAIDQKNLPADASSIHYELIEVLEKKQDPKLAIHDIWAATHINGEAISNTSDTPTLDINTTEMRISGTNGCNNYSGPIDTLNANTFELGAVASTRKMCMDMAVPDRFDKAMGTVSSYKKEGLTLSLLNADGIEVLRFKKVD